ncbi:DUF1648 domain-containing protein [bacterium]|nr:DUF1648 domain-containing protein [bacterium]
MKSTFILIFLIVTLMNVFAWQLLPEKIATHFGKGGRPNGWMSKDANFVVMQGLYLFLFLMFYYSSVLIFKTPQKWISLPNREYWLREENRDITRQKISNGMYEYGIYLFLFFGFIGHLTMHANLNPPVRLDESRFLIALFLFLGLTVYWTVKFILMFRLPKSEHR